MFGEVYDARPGLHEPVHDDGQAARHPRLRLPGQRLDFAQGKATPSCATSSPATTTTPTPTPTPTSCRPSSATTTWAGSAMLLGAAATGDDLMRRARLANSLMYLTRGQPVVYYGDEQGFIGRRRRQGRPPGHVRDEDRAVCRRARPRRARRFAGPVRHERAAVPADLAARQGAGREPGADRRRAGAPLRQRRPRHLRLLAGRPRQRRRVPRRGEQRDGGEVGQLRDLQRQRPLRRRSTAPRTG